MAVFDEKYYLQQNPDVAAAVKAGGLSSALEHYQKYGQSEGRDAYNPAAVSTFDENYYLSSNPDVAAAVQSGGFKSGLEHYLSFGNSEGRTAAEAKKPVQQIQMPTYTRRDDSVTNILTGLTSKDSPLMQQARTSGLKLANRRGLLNSSMAVGAAEDAAYAAAVPIAQTEAGFAASENLANLDAATRLQLQSASDQATLDRLTKSIQSTEKQQQSEITYQTAMQSLDRALQEKLASWNIAETQRDGAARYVVSVEELYQNSVNNIQANQNLDAETRTAYLESARALRDRQLNVGQQLYDVKLDWA